MVLVSVVVTTYYRNDRLREALESVLEQTHAPVETIVVDGSGDAHARSVAESFPCRYVSIDDASGPQRARSIGADLAAGEYVQFLDDDDRIHETKLAKQVPRFRSAEDVGVVYCGRRTESGAVDRPRAELRGDVLDRALAFDGVPCLASAMLIDADVLADLLPLANRHGADDTGMRIELAKRTRFDYVDDILLTAGEPADARGRTWAAIEGKRHLIERYADLYERHPDHVRREALAEVFQKAGRRHLEARPWSPRAIYCFAQALRYVPEVRPLHVGEFVTSLAGRPGRALGAAVLR